MIDKETVDKILDVADIVEVVSDFVHLRRRGANYIGLCPFHNEKTPSFSVSRSKGICKCFSCGKGGSPVNFIMEHEQMSYYEALKYLAKKYNIEIKERELTDEERMVQSERENMLITNEFSLKHFENNLYNTDEGKGIGLSYFYERGFTDAIIKKFRLGYSMERRTDLAESIKSKGLNLKYAVETGLCIESEHGTYDRFRGRVMFPVLNIAGKVIAFGGRTLKKDLAKYVNSPESIIYKKKHELYGLFQAKHAIVNKKKCFLVEGYTDVLSMHQAGIENVVASSGTSLTEGQIRLIHRFTDNITVLYDGDSAGIKASLRGIDLLLAEGLNVKVLLLPDGDDPDSFSKKHNATEFQDYIQKNETDFIRFKTSILLDGLENDPIKKSAAVSDIVKSIAVIPSKITRMMYIKECGSSFGLDEKILITEVQRHIEANLEKERISRKKADNFQIGQATADASEETHPHDVATQEDFTPETFVTMGMSAEEKALKSCEEEVMRYATKYGMCDFCEVVGEKGDKSPIVVLEYINMDLINDDLKFSYPSYRKIFDKALSLIDEFRNEQQLKTIELSHLRKQLYRDGVSNIARRFDNLEEIEREEKKLIDEIDQNISSMMSEFRQGFLIKKLTSDADDEIRTETLNLIIEKYQLSKVHTKYVKIETELDRLNELLPQSLCVWKDAILAIKIKEVHFMLKKCTNEADIDALMRKAAELQYLRSQFAKLAGERVIIP